MPFDDSPPPSASMNIPGSYNAIFDEADQLYRAGELEQAAAICLRMIERLTRLPERRRTADTLPGNALRAAYILLAEIYAKRGDWTAVDTVCQQAQSYASPDLVERWVAEPGRLRLEYGEPAAGRALLEAVVATTPDNFHAWNRLARHYVDESLFELGDAAINQLELIGKSPEQQSIVRSARFYWAHESNDWRKLLQAWRAIQLNKDESDFEALGEIVLRTLIKHGALEEGLEVVEANHFGPLQAEYFRGWLAWLRHDQVRARYLWRHLIENADKSTEGADLAYKALAYCWLEQPAEALRLLLENNSPANDANSRRLLAIALAMALEDDLEAVFSILNMLKVRLSTQAGALALLPDVNWLEFDQLLSDEVVKAKLRPYFDL